MVSARVPFSTPSSLGPWFTPVSTLFRMESSRVLCQISFSVRTFAVMSRTMQCTTCSSTSSISLASISPRKSEPSFLRKVSPSASAALPSRFSRQTRSWNLPCSLWCSRSRPSMLESSSLE